MKSEVSCYNAQFKSVWRFRQKVAPGAISWCTELENVFLVSVSFHLIQFFFHIWKYPLCYLFIAVYVQISFKCMWLRPLILNQRHRTVDRPSLINVFSFSVSLTVSFSLCLSGVPNRTWLWGDDVCYNPSTSYLNMDRNRSDISNCYWSSNRGRAVCFERRCPVDPIWPTVHKVKKRENKTGKILLIIGLRQQLLFSSTWEAHHLQ